MKINFINVGHGRDTWTIDAPKATPRIILDAIRKRRALLSRDVDIDMADGSIIVGGLPVVGHFTIEDPKPVLN